MCAADEWTDALCCARPDVIVINHREPTSCLAMVKAIRSAGMLSVVVTCGPPMPEHLASGLRRLGGLTGWHTALPLLFDCARAGVASHPEDLALTVVNLAKLNCWHPGHRLAAHALMSARTLLARIVTSQTVPVPVFIAGAQAFRFVWQIGNGDDESNIALARSALERAVRLRDPEHPMIQKLVMRLGRCGEVRPTCALLAPELNMSAAHAGRLLRSWAGVGIAEWRSASLVRDAMPALFHSKRACRPERICRGLRLARAVVS